MDSPILRQTMVAAVIGALAVFVSTIFVTLNEWMGLSLPYAETAAAGAMVGTLVLQLFALIVQTFPRGRALVRLPVVGPDAWLFVVTATLTPGVLWHVLAREAPPVMRLIMPGYFTPLIFAMLLQFGRLVRHRRAVVAHD